MGHTKSLQAPHDTDRIVFYPELLREGEALRDNLHPSRIILGCPEAHDRGSAKLLVEGVKREFGSNYFPALFGS